MSGYLHFGDGFGIVYSMEKKILNFIEKYHMLQKEDKVIAGISGGADSICLLFVLLRLQEKIGFDVIAVHVNHDFAEKLQKEMNGLRKHFAGSGMFPVLCIMRM